MLNGVSPPLSLELLKVLAEIGRGDVIILSGAHFPAKSFNSRVLRLDGVKTPELLLGILPVFELDNYDPSPLIMMDALEGNVLDLKVSESYLKSMNTIYPVRTTIKNTNRLAVYEKVSKAFAIVVTDETAKFGNIIIKKGGTPIL